MTEARVPLKVPAEEHGLLRLFAVDSGAPGGAALVAALRAEPRAEAPVEAALGAARIEPYWIDLVHLPDLAGMGLATYLREAHGVTEAALEGTDLATDRRHLLVVPSRAFDGTAQTLRPGPALIPLATFRLADAPAPLAPMARARSAEQGSGGAGSPAEPAPGAAGRSLRPLAILGLLAVAALIVLVLAA